MPANFTELVEFVNEYNDDWTDRDRMVNHLCAEFGNLIMYGPNYSRAVWDNVADYVITGDKYWLGRAFEAKSTVLQRRGENVNTYS